MLSRRARSAAPTPGRPGTQQQYGELSNRLHNDPKSVAISEVDSLIKLYETGFRKLAEAQRQVEPASSSPVWASMHSFRTYSRPDRSRESRP